ncbi:MAG: hypothetical protein LBQ60_08910 [Bacteroidales bacterium]|jgi:hypothetical protein|nr:hypothetical protein [Bacteroidales bacterium]
MSTFLLSIAIGFGVAVLDIVPMVLQRLPTYMTIAAFIHYFFISIIIINIKLPYIPWWMQGGLISLTLITPLMILIGHTDKKPLPGILISALVLGTLVGFAGYVLRCDYF